MSVKQGYLQRVITDSLAVIGLLKKTMRFIVRPSTMRHSVLLLKEIDQLPNEKNKSD